MVRLERFLGFNWLFLLWLGQNGLRGVRCLGLVRFFFVLVKWLVNFRWLIALFLLLLCQFGGMLLCLFLTLLQLLHLLLELFVELFVPLLTMKLRLLRLLLKLLHSCLSSTLHLGLLLHHLFLDILDFTVRVLPNLCDFLLD